MDAIVRMAAVALLENNTNTIAPAISAWEDFNGPFNLDATPIAPLGSPIIIHTKPASRKT